MSAPSDLLGAQLRAHVAEAWAMVATTLERSSTIAGAAEALGVPPRTLARWLARWPELRAALVVGRARHGLDARGYRRGA